MIAGAEVT